MSGLTTGLLHGGINKAISGSGDSLYLHKHDECYRVQKCKGNGLCLAPHPRFVEGDGLLMGKNSPFKNIPFWMGIVIIYLEEMYKIKCAVFLLSG